MVVMKFGGTSVGSAEAIKRVCEIIKTRVENDPIIVVSAVGGITNKFVSIIENSAKKNKNNVQDILAEIGKRHEEIINGLGLEQNEGLKILLCETLQGIENIADKISQAGDLAKHLHDELMSMGELLSANIVAEYLKSIGLEGKFADSRDVMVTDSQFTKAVPQFEESQKNTQQYLKPLVGKYIPVMQGFIGRDSFGRITTLGRGGSDYTATLIGAMLNADVVEIWSDVDGVLTADPSLVKEAKRIKYMSFQEASELAYFGAKVLHPSTLLPAVERNIPVHVLNSMRQTDGGTVIAGSTPNGKQEGCIVKSIAYKEELVVITVMSTRMLMAHGFLASIFEIFNRYAVPVDLVSTSEVTVSLTINRTDHLENITRELGRFAQVRVEQNKSVVCLVGEQMKSTQGMPGELFSLLKDIDIHLISQGASEINISFVIDDKALPKVVSRLHNHYFSGELDPEIFAV